MFEKRASPEVKEGDARLYSEVDETRQILLLAVYAFILNVALTILKAIIAFFANGLAVAASAVDSAIDSFASLAVLGGLKMSARKTRTFPYGLYKIDNVISVIVALFIFVAGYEIFRRALTSVATSTHITPWVIGWLLVSVLSTFLFGQKGPFMDGNLRCEVFESEPMVMEIHWITGFIQC